MNMKIDFQRLTEEEYQNMIKDKQMKNEQLLEIIRKCPFNEVLSDFFMNDNRNMMIFNALSKKDILDLLGRKISFPRSILNSTKLFHSLKAPSIITFRNNINILMNNYGFVEIEKQVLDYYLDILKKYNSKSKIFTTYEEFYSGQSGQYKTSLIDNSDLLMNYRILQNNNDLESLQRITSHIISNIIVDYLFKDNYYNVIANIREMLRYISKTKKILLSAKSLEMYMRVIDLDEIDNEEKIAFFHSLKNKKVEKIYYDDLQRLKKHSYNEISKSLFQIDSGAKKDSLLSSKYQCDIYDLRNQDYYLIIRTLSHPIDLNLQKKYECYSLISNENNSFYHFSDKCFIYGYNHIPIKRIAHVFEHDSFSSTGHNHQVSPYINRIMTKEELVNSSGKYSEIGISNSNEEDSLKPAYIIAIDTITLDIVNESKRLNIPILLLQEKRKNKQVLKALDDINYTYAYSIHKENEREKKRN